MASTVVVVGAAAAAAAAAAVEEEEEGEDGDEMTPILDSDNDDELPLEAVLQLATVA